MKFRDISERVKGGKLDPLSKMGKQKLTGQEVARYYKDNPKAKNSAKDTLIKNCLLYTSPSPRDRQKSRMPSSA